MASSVLSKVFSNGIKKAVLEQKSLQGQPLEFIVGVLFLSLRTEGVWGAEHLPEYRVVRIPKLSA